MLCYEVTTDDGFAWTASASGSARPAAWWTQYGLRQAPAMQAWSPPPPPRAYVDPHLEEQQWQHVSPPPLSTRQQSPAPRTPPSERGVLRPLMEHFMARALRGT
jgi:hypothetical protein